MRLLAQQNSIEVTGCGAARFPPPFFPHGDTRMPTTQDVRLRKEDGLLKKAFVEIRDEDNDVDVSPLCDSDGNGDGDSVEDDEDDECSTCVSSNFRK